MLVDSAPRILWGRVERVDPQNPAGLFLFGGYQRNLLVAFAPRGCSQLGGEVIPLPFKVEISLLHFWI